MNWKLEVRVPLRLRHFLSQKLWHFHKNIHSCVENECCCPYTVNISNVNFTPKCLWGPMKCSICTNESANEAQQLCHTMDKRKSISNMKLPSECWCILTHYGLVRSYIYWVIISSSNGLSPVWHQVITKADSMPIGPWVQYGISIRNAKLKSREILFAHNLLHSYPIILKYCTKHSSDTAVLCAKFQNDWSTVTDFMERVFTRFEFKKKNQWNLNQITINSLHENAFM